METAMDFQKSKYLITIPIDGKMLASAEKFSSQYYNYTKARQVYLNTLAVLVVDFYFQCIDIKTDIAQSSGLNNILNSLMNTAGLFIKDKGLLECRPVLPTEKFCYIPKEIREDCIGYIGVEINELESKAIILGFIKSVEDEKLPLTDLEPLEDFLFYLHKLEKPKFIEL
jgi:Protein of unknown function (DUF1822)